MELFGLSTLTMMSGFLRLVTYAKKKFSITLKEAGSSSNKEVKELSSKLTPVTTPCWSVSLKKVKLTTEQELKRPSPRDQAGMYSKEKESTSTESPCVTTEKCGQSTTNTESGSEKVSMMIIPWVRNGSRRLVEPFKFLVVTTVRLWLSVMLRMYSS